MDKTSRYSRHVSVPVLLSLCLTLSVITAFTASARRAALTLPSGNPPVGGFTAALQLPGDNSSYASVSPGPVTTGLSALTIEAWVNPVSLTGRAEIASKDPVFFLLQDGKPSIWLGGTDNPGFHTSATAVQAGVWSHVAATWNGSVVKIYVNGIETYSGAASGTTASASPGTALGIGVCLTCSPDNTGFNGCLDEIRIWNAARSAASLQGAMRQGLIGNESGLTAYYRADENSGTTLNDVTANAHHATLTGSVVRKTTGLADDFTTAEDTLFTGRLFGYDAENDPLTYSIVSNGSKGTATITDASTGAFTYQPAPNQNGTDSFTYKINAGSADSATVTVSVSITPVNDNPVINAGSAVAVSQNGSVSGVTIATVSDAETAAGSLTVTPGTLPAGLTISDLTNTNGTITATVSATCQAAAGANTIVLNVSDADGGTAAASLTVNVTAQTVNITAHPISQSVCPGSTAIFIITATGDGPFFYQWRKNGSSILGANSNNYAVVGASAGDAATYDCVVTSVNGCTSAVSNAATLTLRTATSITFHPVSRTVCEGASVSFSVSADGQGTINYQWRKNGTPITGATSSSYSIAEAAVGDEGSYDCVVTSGCGSQTSSAATLTVNTPPTITSNPPDRNTTVGATLNLIATASGSPTPEVRWQLSTDGGLAFNTIVGATGTTLTLANVSLAMDGYKYRAVFTSPCGTTYSAISKLTVSPAATTTTIAASGGATVYGQAAGFTAYVLRGTDPITEGTVTFLDGSTTLGTVALNGSGQAVFSTSSPGAGTHSINARFNGTANYLTSSSNAAATLTVSKATLTVTASNATKVYGASLPAFSAVYSGFVNGESTGVLTGQPDFSTVATSGSPVGDYTITPSTGTLASANYNFTFASGTLSVTKATLMVSADNRTRVYGAANPALTSTITGFVNNDSTSVISGTPALTTTASASSAAGTYPITVNASGLSAANYNFTTSSGTLTITKAVLTVRADDAARVYGATNPAFSYSISGFINGDAAGVVSGTPVLTTTATTSSAAGTYPITVSTSGLSAANYTFTATNGTLTISKAVLSVKADDAARTYGAANPTFTYSVSGFVNGDTASVISGTPALSTTATPGSAVGTYAIAADVSSLTAASYSFTASNGTLTINKAALSVKADDKSKAFGAQLPTLTVTYAGFVNGETAAVLSGALNVSTTATASSPAGTYPITAGGLSSTNYNVSFASGTLTVTAVSSQPVLTASNNPSQWGQAVTLTATISKASSDAAAPTGTVTFKNGSTVVGTGSVNGSGQATLTLSNLTVGAHQITAEYGGDNNYSAAASAALTLTVSKADTTTTLVSSANPVTVSQPVTFTATVSSAAGTPSGIVEFFDGTVSLGTAPLSNGSAFVTTSTLTAGDHSIRAVYNGDPSFASSSSAAISQTINPACTWALSATSIIADVGSGAYSVNVTARGDCAWTAASNVSWITISSGQSGSGNGTVSLTVEPLGNLASRSGTLTVAGQTVTITQSRGFTVVSAAGYEGGTMSNDQLLAGFGIGISPVTAAAPSLPLTDTLGDVKVRITDSAGVERLAKLLFVSPNQINFVAPTGMVSGPATLTVLNGELEIAIGTINVITAAPGLFAANATGRGVAAALALRAKADGTQIYEPVAQFDNAQNQFVAVPIDLGADQTPASDQVFLVLFCTGVRYRTSQNNVSVKIGGIDAEVLYAGAQPSFAGLDQINVRLPGTLAGRGEVEVIVTVDGKAANPVTVSIR